MCGYDLCVDDRADPCINIFFLIFQGTQASPKAFPISNPELTTKILDVLRLAAEHKQLKKGANEGILRSLLL